MDWNNQSLSILDWVVCKPMNTKEYGINRHLIPHKKLKCHFKGLRVVFITLQVHSE